MKEEDIENAAREESGIWSPNPVHLHDLYRRDDFEAGFHRGANWRINSVWHDVSERPDENEPTIVEKINGKVFLAEKGYNGPWKYNVEQFGFKRWAYIKDLIPNMED